MPISDFDFGSLSGLFGPTPEDKSAALNTGLLGAGAALLSNQSPRLGPGLGAAMLQGVGGYQGALQQAQQQRFAQWQTGMKLAEMQRQEADRQRRQAAINAAKAQFPDLAPLFDVDPESAIQQAYPKREAFTLSPGAMRYGADGKPIAQAPSAPTDFERSLAAAGIDPKSPQGQELYRQWLTKQTTHAQPSSTPYFQFIPTPEGIAVGNARTGGLSLGGINGKPVMRADTDPTLQGRIAEAREAGKTYGEETTKAQLDFPRVVQNAETALRLSDELLKHPGFDQAVGQSSLLQIQKIPGTSARDFMSRLDQIKGGAFLEAFNSLKGGGQITEVEGKKATDAIARMDNSTSEGEFRAAVRDFQDVVRKGMNRAKMKAKPVGPVQQPEDQTAPVPAAPAPSVKFLGFE